MNTTYNVRVWKLQTLKGQTRTTYGVRWVVARRPFRETFKSRPLADSFRSELLTAIRKKRSTLTLAALYRAGVAGRI